MTSPHPEVCVGAVIVRDSQLLLVQRGRGAGVGAWSIPGGRVELGESLAEAVRREVAEEVGLTARAVRYLGHVERIGAGWHFVIHDFAVDVDLDADPQAGDDAAAVQWADLEGLAGVDGLIPGLVDFLADYGIIAH